MSSLEGLKVITTDEMARIENLAYLKGFEPKTFMENAGNKIAEHTRSFINSRKLKPIVTLLIGKGNNGGDAYAAGVKLLEFGFSVTAFNFFPLDASSPLCQEEHRRFKDAGGKVLFSPSSQPLHGVILDGLVGTGFCGPVEGILRDAIELANGSNLPIIALDIPSGLNGATGEVQTIAVKASLTITLGLPKIGLFIGQGWNHVGELIIADFGLGQEFIEKAKPLAFLLNESVIKDHLPKLERTQHKYQKGYVIAVAGSSTMNGAAILTSASALRSGAGIVRLFHLEEMQFGETHPEIIHEKIALEEKEKILSEAKRAGAALIGPGLGRSEEVKILLKYLLLCLPIPCVIDADALYFLGENPEIKCPKNSILTPHHKEMERLLGKGFTDDIAFLEAAQEYVEKQEVTLVLKGAPTFILHPKTPPLIIPRGDPGMATAGSGDVLTGIIAAFLAHRLDPLTASILGVYVHCLAGEIAAQAKTSYCVVASDLIEFLPQAFKKIDNISF